MSKCITIPKQNISKHGKIKIKTNCYGVENEPIVFDPTKGDLIIEIVHIKATPKCPNST